MSFGSVPPPSRPARPCFAPPRQGDQIAAPDTNPVRLLSHEREKSVETALQLWLRWNENYEKLTEMMFQQATDFTSLQRLADELDELRQKAVALTKQLVQP